MLALADCRGDPYWNFIWKPNLSPSQIYLANALSEWAARALAQASMSSEVLTLDRATPLWGNCGLCSCSRSHIKSAMYGYRRDQLVG